MADADEGRARQSVIDAGLELARTGLSPQQSGNVSVRFRDDAEMARVIGKFRTHGQ